MSRNRDFSYPDRIFGIFKQNLRGELVSLKREAVLWCLLETAEGSKIVYKSQKIAYEFKCHIASRKHVS